MNAMNASRSRLRKPASLLVTVIVLTLTTVTAGASGPTHQWDDDDLSHDRARRAVANGEALPVTEVLRHLRAQVQGDIVATEYEYEFDRWVYEFKLVDRLGRMRKVHIDAATGKWIEGEHD